MKNKFSNFSSFSYFLLALMFASMTAVGQSNNDNVLVEEVAPQEAATSATDEMDSESMAGGVRSADTKLEKEMAKEERQARKALKAERKAKKAERKAKKAAESVDD